MTTNTPCPGCNTPIDFTPSTPNGTALVVPCPGCDGLIGNPDIELKRDVLARAMGIEIGELWVGMPTRYFDFNVDGRRVHGWLDSQRRIVQYG